MEYFASQDPRSYSSYFNLNIWFRARKVTGTFGKQPHVWKVVTMQHRPRGRFVSSGFSENKGLWEFLSLAGSQNLP